MSSFQQYQSSEVDALQARFGLRVAAHLSRRADTLPADVSERLRFAREQAVERARVARVARKRESAAAAIVANGSTLSLGRGGFSEGRWWMKLAAVVPLAALIAGLLIIQDWQTRAQIRAAADIDAELLADDLPPDAYSDPGFVEFLKSPPRE